MTTTPADLFEGGSPRQLRGGELLQFLTAITPGTTTAVAVAEYPFRFRKDWRRGYMTANVRSALEMAATGSLAAHWLAAGAAPFAEEGMVRALCAYVRLRRQCAVGDFDANNQPVTSSVAIEGIAVALLRLASCAHATSDPASMTSCVASAASAREALRAIVIEYPPWKSYASRLLRYSNTVVARSYAACVAEWQQVPAAGGALVQTTPVTVQMAVADALTGHPAGENRAALLTLRQVYGHPGPGAKLPVSDALRDGTALPLFPADPLPLPDFTVVLGAM